MTRVALIAGVDRYENLGRSNWLRYCWEDAKSAWWWSLWGGFSEWHICRDNRRYALGFPGKNLEIYPARTSYVIPTLELLAHRLLPEDVFFHFVSSHGGQVPAINPAAEEDDLEEGLILNDYKGPSFGFLRDKNLINHMKAFREGVIKITILDSCHSAGMAKAGLFYPLWKQKKVKGIGTISPKRQFKTLRESEIVPNWTIIAACGPDDYAMEDPALKHGVMTAAITEAIRKYGLKLTKSELVEEVNSIISGQTVYLLGDSSRFNKPLFK